MARPRKHDGVVFKRSGTQVLWMSYLDRDGKRIRESTFTQDWQEAVAGDFVGRDMSGYRVSRLTSGEIERDYFGSAETIEEFDCNQTLLAREMAKRAQNKPCLDTCLGDCLFGCIIRDANNFSWLQATRRVQQWSKAKLGVNDPIMLTSLTLMTQRAFEYC